MMTGGTTIFFVGGDLGIPLTPRVCPPEISEDVKWMVGQDTLRNLERLKGRSWPLKDFLRHVRNDISLHAKTLGYNVLKEVIPPLGTVLMKRARRGYPPSTQLGKEAAAEGGGEKVGVLEPVCGGAIVDVVEENFGEPAGGEQDAWVVWTNQKTGWRVLRPEVPVQEFQQREEEELGRRRWSRNHGNRQERDRGRRSRRKRKCCTHRLSLSKNHGLLGCEAGDHVNKVRKHPLKF
ncbi:hypothetical protein AXF42_Ash013216 [Apostasia shenzhenica]|uniref:Uncharacterized protein n=1 Tax=Apostasia shenzhenica TaxID=1088818 RepID=A0A2I0BBC3_9ASPA|nr:hypothetical protein AXF42_Ash013216 [Apostasia shenzhenica]